jgi:hypothetical protein
MWDDFVEEVRALLGHAPAIARRAQAPDLARQRDELVLAAGGAVQPNQPPNQPPAIAIPLERPRDELRQGMPVASLATQPLDPRELGLDDAV